jgi:hypothetical protein
MERIEQQHPDIRVFSLPSVDHPQYGRRIGREGICSGRSGRLDKCWRGCTMLVRIAALNWCENSGSRLCTLACTVLVRRGAEVLLYHLECSVPVHESTDLARKLLFVWKIF